MDEVYEKFELCYGSKTKLKETLRGETKITSWNKLEDLTLKNKSTDSEEYAIILELKGADEIVRRKRFLG